MEADDIASSSSSPPSRLESTLARATSTFAEHFTTLTSDLLTQWLADKGDQTTAVGPDSATDKSVAQSPSSINFLDAEASISYLVQLAEAIKKHTQNVVASDLQSFAATPRSGDSTDQDESHKHNEFTNQIWAVLRDIHASEVRFLIASSLGDTVALDEGSEAAGGTTLLLYAMLDATTALQEVDLVDGALALQIIEEVTERLTVDSACRVFEYLESRVRFLTRDLSPSRGKGLVLLRLLNDLLRRLSKPSRSHLVLSGRILSLLGSVFPLGERSGVNLRGEFNVGNVTKFEEASTHEHNDRTNNGERSDPKDSGEEEEEDNKDADPAAMAAKDVAFYSSFWGLQQYFANPTLLMEPAGADSNDADTDAGEHTGSSGDDKAHLTDTERLKQEERSSSVDVSQGSTSGKGSPAPGSDSRAREAEAEEGAASSTPKHATPAPPSSPLDRFRTATRRILDVFAEANLREREVEQAERAAAKGASSAAAKKKKREEMLRNNVGAMLDQADKGGSSEEEGAFPKYLTGRRVFEYQLRSPPFRRHILLQYLILFQYLLSFNPTQKEKSSEWKNKQLLLAYPLTAEFTLGEEDEQWIRRCWREIVGLLEDTGPRDHGRTFKNSVLQTLRRESRWIHWKAENCPAIDKPTMSSDLVEACKTTLRDTLLRPRPPYVHSLGTFALSELWEDGLEPVVPGKRRGENEEGVEVELDTDGLEQLELPPGIPSVSTYAKLVKQQEARAEMRRRKLGVSAADLTAAAESVKADASSDEKMDTQPDGAADGGADEAAQAAKEKEQAVANVANLKRKRELLEKTDEELVAIDERKTSLNWRAVRIARNDTLRLWGKIRGGDVELLLEAEKEERVREAERERQRAAEQEAKTQEKMQTDDDGGSSTKAAAAEAGETAAAGVSAPEPTSASAVAKQSGSEAMDVDSAVASPSVNVPGGQEAKTPGEAVEVPSAAPTEDTSSAPQAEVPAEAAISESTPGAGDQAKSSEDPKHVEELEHQKEAVVSQPSAQTKEELTME